MGIQKTKCLLCKSEAEMKPTEEAMVQTNKGMITINRYICPFCHRIFWRRQEKEVRH